MKKIFLLVVFLVAFGSISFGQLQLGLNLGNYTPTGSGSGYNSALGFSVDVGYVNEDGVLGLRIGHQDYAGDSDGSDSDYNLSVTPIALYYRDYLGKNHDKKFNFFWGGEIGAYLYKTDGTIEGIDISSSKTYFGGAIEL